MKTKIIKNRKVKFKKMTKITKISKKMIYQTIIKNIIQMNK